MQIATAITAKSKIWKNLNIPFDQFAKLLELPKIVPYTLKEYLALPKDKQRDLKDMGGYVGGYLKGGRRKPDNVACRTLLTLDLDKDVVEDLPTRVEAAGAAAIVHSTFKSSDKAPRYRIIVLLDKEVTGTQYMAIARRYAEGIGLEMFDPTTFEIHRLMYWPGKPTDTNYFFKVIDTEPLDTTAYLESYRDYKDVSEWPTLREEKERIVQATTKQQDPTEKSGIVGAFCRTYSIAEAIEKFLSDKYEPCDHEDRYTYRMGEAAAGLIVYEDKFAYSHHGTDPAGGQLCNAFDLVRIHKFGYEDQDSSESLTKLPSYRLMVELAESDNEVTKTYLAERRAEIAEAFGEEQEIPEEDNTDMSWMAGLSRTKAGIESTAKNIDIILMNDPKLKKRFRFNEFDNRRYVFGSTPWRDVKRYEQLEDLDHAGLRSYLDTYYGITGERKVKDALLLELNRNKFNPVKDYLNSLEWDGIERLNDLLIRYFAAPDTEFTRIATRKTIVAGVARVYEPGIKFDHVLVLVGGQGAGKSQFGRTLCCRDERWFNDHLEITDKANAMEEAVQGAWICEIAELAGMSKTDVNRTKSFISRQSDNFRGAYKEESKIFYRQGIIIASTNEDEFLRDMTGDRRWWPVDVDRDKAEKNVFDLKPEEVDQIWAEAKELYKAGERLWLTREEEKLANKVQYEHSLRDQREGLIDKYLDTLLPEDWERRGIYERREFLNEDIKGTVERQFVCTAEIWCECMGKPKEDMSRYNTREINEMMRGNRQWVASNSTREFGIYGRQKYYERKL